MASKSKQKGSRFERQVCVDLSLWVSGGVHRDLFWRAAMSGGRATVARKANVTLARHAGDISTTSKEGHPFTARWFVECKSYMKLDVESFLFKGKGKLREFWTRAVDEAEHYRKAPMLIAHQNLLPVFVVIAQYDCEDFRWAKRSRLFETWDGKRSVAVLDYKRMLEEKFQAEPWE